MMLDRHVQGFAGVQKSLDGPNLQLEEKIQDVLCVKAAEKARYA